jgi:intraflagellar transport protein 74
VQRDERGLCDELAIWELSDPKQALEQLKKRVEQQSRELKELDATSRELKDATKSSQKSLQELGDELTERTGESGGDKDKYDKLRQRDEEMALFIEEFDATRGSTLEDAGRARETIVALLEHVSLGLEQEHSMPSQQRLREMKDEATFKERQLESSQQTTSRLVHERRQREAELLKIENLDEKIGVELGSLKHKMERMRADMIEFDDTEGLRHRAAATISQLSRLLKEYQGRRESVKSQVTHLTQKYEQLKNKIQHSETAKTLSTLEAKLRTYAQTIFHLQEYVETKGRETDYKAVKENCNQLVDKLNAIARKTNEGGA